MNSVQLAVNQLPTGSQSDKKVSVHATADSQTSSNIGIIITQKILVSHLVYLYRSTNVNIIDHRSTRGGHDNQTNRFPTLSTTSFMFSMSSTSRYENGTSNWWWSMGDVLCYFLCWWLSRMLLYPILYEIMQGCYSSMSPMWYSTWSKTIYVDIDHETYCFSFHSVFRK